MSVPVARDPPQLQYPVPLQSSVLQIKSLLSTYESTTDVALKASYKVVIADRVALAQVVAEQYSGLVKQNLSALVPS